MNKKTLSVCLITYNHKKFIRQTLESILMQKVSFSWELVIADDFSTDGTRKILLEYKNKYPDFIKLILQESNVGAAKNWLELMSFSKSKYLAYIEGDDYWIDNFKLHKQVEVLEKNNSISLVFHNCFVLNEKGEKKVFKELYSKPIYAGEDLLKEWIIPTCSMVFLNIFKDKKIPLFIKKAQHGDLALQLYLTHFGKLYVINEVMGVYRRLSSGISSSFHGLEHNNKNIKAWFLAKSFFSPKYKKEINEIILKNYLLNCNHYRDKSFSKGAYWLVKAFLFSPKLFFLNRKEYILSLKITLLTLKNKF